MSATAVREKRQVTLPQDVFEAAGLEVGDQVEWEVADGEIRGRKLVRAPEPRRIVAKLVKRGHTLVFELPKGHRLDPEAIGRAVAEERRSRS